MTVVEIIEEYLGRNNFDGLYNAEDCCSCRIGDLEPCTDMSGGGVRGDCKPGYLHVLKGPCEFECDVKPGEVHWHISEGTPRRCNG